MGNTHMKWKSNFRLPFFKILIFRMKSLRSPFSLIRVMLSEAMKRELQVPEICKERLSDGGQGAGGGLSQPWGCLTPMAMLLGESLNTSSKLRPLFAFPAPPLPSFLSGFLLYPLAASSSWLSWEGLPRHRHPVSRSSIPPSQGRAGTLHKA